jgi:uncharacterized coiled-coil protein SlyX
MRLADMTRQEIEELVKSQQQDIAHYRRRIRRLTKRIAHRDNDFERRNGFLWRDRNRS